MILIYHTYEGILLFAVSYLSIHFAKNQGQNSHLFKISLFKVNFRKIVYLAIFNIRTVSFVKLVYLKDWITTIKKRLIKGNNCIFANQYTENVY